MGLAALAGATAGPGLASQTLDRNVTNVRLAVNDSRAVGLSAVNNPPFCAASRYRPAFTLMEVLPVPNTSKATPPRGVRS